MYPTEIQKVLCSHLPGLHSVDRCLLLPNGLVGPSGQLFKHIFYQCDGKVLCACVCRLIKFEIMNLK